MRKLYTIVTASLVWGSILMAQPQFTYNFDTAAEAKITIGYDVRGTTHEEVPWLVHIKNDSGRPIIGLTVKYDYYLIGIGESGAVSVLHTAPNGRSFMPGETHTFRPSKSDKVMQQLIRLATKVTVSIDAVAFSKDEVLGPDKAGLRDRLIVEGLAVSRVNRELERARSEFKEAEYIESLVSTKPAVSCTGDPRDDMHCAPIWENQIRWQLGHQLKEGK